jgi:hypothetical protein
MGRGGGARGGRRADRLVLYVALVAAPEDRHLGTVRHYLTLGEADFAALLDEMSATEACFGLVRQGANGSRQKEARLLSNVQTSTHRHTEILDSPSLLGVVSAWRISSGRRSRCISCCRRSICRRAGGGCG